MEINSLNTKRIIDLIYPIGCFFETTNANFNPNNVFGGTWVQDTVGYCLVGANVDEDAGIEKANLVNVANAGTIGEAKHKLTTAEMPSHSHSVLKDRRIMVWDSGSDQQGNINQGTGPVQTRWDTFTSEEGSDQLHNNTQPSYGVIRWHRTA